MDDSMLILTFVDAIFIYTRNARAVTLCIYSQIQIYHYTLDRKGSLLLENMLFSNSGKVLKCPSCNVMKV